MVQAYNASIHVYLWIMPPLLIKMYIYVMIINLYIDNKVMLLETNNFHNNYNNSDYNYVYKLNGILIHYVDFKIIQIHILYIYIYIYIYIYYILLGLECILSFTIWISIRNNGQVSR